jgi:dihydroxyacetone kinase
MKRTVTIDRGALKTSGAVTPEKFVGLMRAIADTIRSEKDHLSRLDGVLGDGDHGITMDIGWTAVRGELEARPDNEVISETCERMAHAFLTAVGASSGPLYASAFRFAGKAVSDRHTLDGAAMAAWIKGMSDGILSRGGAKLGDKTMIDAWVPAAEAAVASAQSGADERGVLQAARDAAKAGMEHTAKIESKRGRSAKLGARSVGHVDPGAASAYLTLRAMHDGL